MAIKLHRCNATWVKLSGHPCWRVQQALDRAGIEYQVVKHPGFPRSRRHEVERLSGQRALPVLELEDGTVVREESKRMVERIAAGEFGGRSAA